MGNVGVNNLRHALRDCCSDPDCEIHHPDVIETDAERRTALAWWFVGANAGATALADQVGNALDNMREELDHEELQSVQLEEDEGPDFPKTRTEDYVDRMPLKDLILDPAARGADADEELRWLMKECSPEEFSLLQRGAKALHVWGAGTVAECWRTSAIWLRG